MPSVTVERVPVRSFGLGLFGFDHLQIVFRYGDPGGPHAAQEAWFVIEGLRERDIAGRTVLAVEGWDGGTTLAEANGGLTGDALEARIGAPETRGPRVVAEGPAAVETWASLVTFAADVERQQFPYIAVALPGSPHPAVNSSSLVASLLHHAGIAVEAALPPGTRFSPGLSTLLGTSGADTLAAAAGFDTVLAGAGADRLYGSQEAARVDKLYGGAGNDVIHWSAGFNILHGGQPGMPRAADGYDAVDYSGAGVVSLSVPPLSRTRAAPDFIVKHAGGEDHLFSIEEIIWDSRSDRLEIGPGVAIAPVGSVLAPGRQSSVEREESELRARIFRLPTPETADGRASDGPGREDPLQHSGSVGALTPLSMLDFDDGTGDDGTGDDWAGFDLGEWSGETGDLSPWSPDSLWG